LAQLAVLPFATIVLKPAVRKIKQGRLLAYVIIIIVVIINILIIIIYNLSRQNMYKKFTPWRDW